MVSQVHQGKPMQCTQITNESSDHYTCNNNMMQFLGSWWARCMQGNSAQGSSAQGKQRPFAHTQSRSRKQELSIFGYTGLPGTYQRAAQCHQYACAHAPAYTPLWDWPCCTTQEPKQKKTNMHVPTFLNTHHCMTDRAVPFRKPKQKENTMPYGVDWTKLMYVGQT